MKNILIISCKLYIKSQKSITYILPNYFFKVLKKMLVTAFGKRLPINNKCQSMSIVNSFTMKKNLKCIYLHILVMVH